MAHLSVLLSINGNFGKHVVSGPSTDLGHHGGADGLSGTRSGRFRAGRSTEPSVSRLPRWPRQKGSRAACRQGFPLRWPALMPAHGPASRSVRSSCSRSARTTIVSGPRCLPASHARTSSMRSGGRRPWRLALSARHLPSCGRTLSITRMPRVCSPEQAMTGASGLRTAPSSTSSNTRAGGAGCCDCAARTTPLSGAGCWSPEPATKTEFGKRRTYGRCNQY